MKKVKVLLLFLVLSIFFPRIVLADRVVAEVGPYKLYEKDLEEILANDPQIREILKQMPQLRSQVERSVIDRWLSISLLALGAKEAGIPQSSSFKRKLEETEKMLLAEELLQRELKNIEITEKDLREFYEKNRNQYKEPEGVKLRHILIYVPKDADNKTKERALTRAKQIRAQLLKGVKFEELAKIHSDDIASKEKGGDLGIIRRGETVPEFEDKVFKLKPGEISEPILSPYGYHIVRVERRIPEEILPYEKVKDRVREDLLREKERELLVKLIERLREKHPPKIYIEGQGSEGGR